MSDVCSTMSLVPMYEPEAWYDGLQEILNAQCRHGTFALGSRYRFAPG